VLSRVRAVPAAEIARTCTDPAQIPARIHAARVAAAGEARKDDSD